MRSKDAPKKKLLSLRSQRGVSMVEYTLLLSMIAIVAIVNLVGLGQTTDSTFRTMRYEIKTQLANSGIHLF